MSTSSATTTYTYAETSYANPRALRVQVDRKSENELHCQAFEIVDGGGEQELVPDAAQPVQSGACQPRQMGAGLTTIGAYLRNVGLSGED